MYFDIPHKGRVYLDRDYVDNNLADLSEPDKKAFYEKIKNLFDLESTLCLEEQISEVTVQDGALVMRIQNPEVRFLKLHISFDDALEYIERSIARNHEGLQHRRVMLYLDSRYAQMIGVSAALKHIPKGYTQYDGQSSQDEKNTPTTSSDSGLKGPYSC